MQTNAGIAGLLGIARPNGTDQPRLTLVPARCAEGISRSGAGFRVIHTLSGKYLGTVALRASDGWCWICPKQDCAKGAGYGHPTADAAATALSAHMLDHGLALVRARLAAAGGAVV